MNSTPPNGFLTADPPVHSSLLPSPRNLKSLCLEGPPPALLPKSQQGLKEWLTTPSSGKPSTTAQQLPFYTMSFKPTNSQASCPGTLSDRSLTSKELFVLFNTAHLKFILSPHILFIKLGLKNSDVSSVGQRRYDSPISYLGAGAPHTLTR